MYRISVHHPLILLLLGTVLLTTGCDNTVEPFSEKGRYSVYGYLSATRDQQFVRVKPLPLPITEVDSGSLTQTSVALKNTNTGRTHRLQDSVITFRDEGSGVVTHNFWTDLSLESNTTYRLTVKGPRGKTVATATTPKRPTKTVSPRQGNCLDQFDVVLQDFRIRRFRNASIRIRHAGEWKVIPATEAVGVIDNPNEDRLQLSFKPESILDDRIPEQSLPDDKNPQCWYAPRCSELDSPSIQVRFSYLGPDWYGDVPEDSLVYNPLNSFFVTDGLGFFGALGRAQATASVDTSELVFLDSEFCSR